MNAMKNEFEPREAVSWHTLPVEEVYGKLSSGPGGLSEEEVVHRLQQFGPNELPARKPPGIITIFLHQFKSPLIYILLVAAVISFALQDYKDAGFIMAVVSLNAVIGLVQEWKAEKSASRLQSLLRITAHVRRGGKEEEIDSATIVPGEIVLLESGIRVPADLRLIHAANLAVDESLLTGESVAVKKNLALADADASIGDRRNMAFAGTTVMTGRGMGVVAATGQK
ncbi:MAG TPA: ATPase, partial [Methanolinea sp.]|nr:ATPase [Methanolinea sp.]